MREIALTASRRTSNGKGFARRTRMSGHIPGVVYGPEQDPLSVAVEEHAFRLAMKTATRSTIFNLQVEGNESKVLVREVQRHPVSNRVTHVDFHAISMTKPIHVSIPITFTGIPIGVKVDGGIMQATMRELSISCLPTDIPDQFEVDVSELSIGASIHVRDVSIPNATILEPPQRTIVVISAPTIIKSAAETAVEEAAAAAAAGEGVVEGEGAEEAKKEEEPKDEKKK